MKSESILVNILSNFFIKDIFWYICNSVFLLATIWCVVESILWLTLNFYSLISTVHRNGVWVCSRTLIACSATRCVKGSLSSTLSLLPMFLLTWQIQSCTRSLILGIFFGIVFTKFILYSSEVISDLRLCRGCFIPNEISAYFLRNKIGQSTKVKQLKNKRPTWCHLLFYFTSCMLNMFRTLIYPSSGACDCSVQLPHWSYFSWFDVCWSFGAVGLEWYPCCRLKHNFYPSTVTMMHGPINIK